MKTTPSDTPKTDAEVKEVGDCYGPSSEEMGPMVTAEFARELERALAAAQERIRAQDEELLAARAEAALQHNYSCEHDGGCALTDENGYRSQALKYVENYHALKAALAQEREARRAAERAIVSLATFVSELASDNRNAALTMKKHRKAIDAAIAGTK